MSDPNVVFLDTETTGLRLDQEIWEAATISWFEGGWVEDVWQLPVDLGNADPVALRLGHFYERRFPASRLTPLDTFSYQFEEIVRDKHIVGNVVSFDDKRLERLVMANGACPDWHYHIIDVEALCAGYLHGLYVGTTANFEEEFGRPPQRPWTLDAATPNWKSSELSEAMRVPLPSDEELHTALGDARWSKRLYEAVMGPL